MLLKDVIQDERYLSFIEHFNVKRDYYHCHDLLEEMWLLNKDELGVLKYLIQVSIMQYKKLTNNELGFIKLRDNSLSRFHLYQSDLEFLGIDSEVLYHDLIEVKKEKEFYEFILPLYEK